MRPAILFLNTKEIREGGGELVQTTFRLAPFEDEDLVIVGLLNGHQPSCADDLFTPFYPDPSQRVIAVQFPRYDDGFVIKAETVLRLVQEREGEDLDWEEWKEYVTWVSPKRPMDNLWVS